MKLHQLRYLAAVAQSGLNITAAAQKLHTSQPGVSKQIKLLEDELGFQIFVREGRNLTRITAAGQQVIERALRILQEASAIRSLSTELRDEGKGSLSIGTTHTQARYVLPDVIRGFRGRYPQVRLNLHQGTSEQIAEMVASDRIDCAIATGSEHLFSDLTLLPCYRWHRSVIVPRGHPLSTGGRLTLKALAAHHVHCRLIVARRVLGERGARAVALMERAGVEVRAGSFNEKYSVVDGKHVWIGSANSTSSYYDGDRIEWGLRSDAPRLAATLESRFEAHWRSAHPFSGT